VEQEQGKPVPDLPNLSIVSLIPVQTIRRRTGNLQRPRRRQAPQEEAEGICLLLPAYEEKEFVPRDLTTTSQLVRLVRWHCGSLHRLRESARGRLAARSVTGTVRKAWKVLGCLSLANPQSSTKTAT